jgi:hypothetical protein
MKEMKELVRHKDIYAIKPTLKKCKTRTPAITQYYTSPANHKVHPDPSSSQELLHQ